MGLLSFFRTPDPIVTKARKPHMQNTAREITTVTDLIQTDTPIRVDMEGNTKILYYNTEEGEVGIQVPCQYTSKMSYEEAWSVYEQHAEE